jgi:diguanylate cyclase (GGDEF)-like protein
VPFQLRDEQGASRAVAYLMMTAAPYVFITGVVFDPHRPTPALVAITFTCLVLGLGGAACRWLPQHVPTYVWLIMPFFAVLVISGMNLVTEDSSAGAQLFYLWPVLYTADFLGRRIIYLILAVVSAAEAIVVFTLHTADDALSDWSSLTIAMTLTAVIVSSLRERNERLRDVLETQALADALTGVANRRSFDVELARSVTWAHHTGEPIALLTLDVDHFKRINDTWGHAVGDQALQAVAAALRIVAGRRDGDGAARLGGDEFVVLLRTDRMGARRAADEIRETLGRAGALPCGTPGLSIGVAVLPDHAGTGEELMGASDAALYEAKTGGRGRTAMAHPPPQRQIVEHLPRDAGVTRSGVTG